MRATFLSLSPTDRVTYSLFALTCYGILNPLDVYEYNDDTILVKDGEVYISRPVVVDNTFTGKREPLELVTE